MEPNIADSEFKERIKNTEREMEQRDLDALIVFSSYPEREGHVSYLTNYHSAFPPSQHDGTYKGLGYTALALSKGTGPVLFPGLLFASGRLVGVDRVESSEDIATSVAEFFTSKLDQGENISTIGLVGVDIFPSAYLDALKHEIDSMNAEVSFVDAESILIHQRMRKSPAEQQVLRKGAKIADAAILAAQEATKPDVRESDIALAALKTAFDEGADYVARTRVYGHNISGVRWPILTNRKLERGEITGIDLVGWFNGYGFDVLRHWTVGQPSEEQKNFLSSAATLTEETVKKITPGMTGDEVSNATVELASYHKLEGKPSPFGHAIGLEIVENPLLLPKSDVRVPLGACVCVEPGLESERHSAHFEDEVLVKQNGSVETISKCTKLFW